MAKKIIVKACLLMPVYILIILFSAINSNLLIRSPLGLKIQFASISIKSYFLYR